MNPYNPLMGGSMPLGSFGLNSGVNQGLNANPANMQSDSFRNVYGVLGGVQSLLHIFTSILDLLYFLKAFKTLVIDLVIKILKKLLGLIKYLFTLKWMFDLLARTNSLYSKFIYSSKYFYTFSIVFKLTLLLSITTLMILKYLKLQQIKSFEDKTEEKMEEGEKSSNGEININYPDHPLHDVQSEERWKIKP